MKTNCPHCDSRLNVSAPGGAMVRCQFCNAPFAVATPASTPEIGLEDLLGQPAPLFHAKFLIFTMMLGLLIGIGVLVVLILIRK